MEDRKIIGITMGDPASIGPEITVKALADQSIYEACRPIVVGDACVLEAALKIVGHEEMTVRAVKDVRDAVFTHGTIDVLDMGLVSMDELVRGQVSAMCGDAAFRYVEKVIELAMDGQVDATVTNAFNKEAVNLAGHHYSGHTEIYADLTGTKNYTMMLAHENMRVVHVSTHVSLREACDRVKKQRVLDVIRIGDKACREMGIENPRIAVAGLNPHSGEHGLFGQEEIREIIPAIEAARAEGIRAESNGTKQPVSGGGTGRGSGAGLQGVFPKESGLLSDQAGGRNDSKDPGTAPKGHCASGCNPSHFRLIPGICSGASHGGTGRPGRERPAAEREGLV